MYRTACKLATAYWRGELARRIDHDGELLSNLHDNALSLEEALDHDLRAKCVRELMSKLPMPRDREVLERFYLQGGSAQRDPRIHESDRAAVQPGFVAGAAALRRDLAQTGLRREWRGSSLNGWVTEQWTTFSSSRTRPPPPTWRTS